MKVKTGYSNETSLETAVEDQINDTFSEGQLEQLRATQSNLVQSYARLLEELERQGILSVGKIGEIVAGYDLDWKKISE